jgi:Signal peptide peptidase
MMDVLGLLTMATGSIYLGSKLGSQKGRGGGKKGSSVDENSGRGSENSDEDDDESGEDDEVVDLTFTQIMIMPISASVMLLLMFYFFEYIQYVVLVVLVMGSLLNAYELIDKALRSFNRWCMGNMSKRSISLLSIVLACAITLEWLRSGNFIAHDLLACALAISCIATLRFPNLKLATICLSLLVVYDIYWVFYSEYYFSGKNVMVEVATKRGDNPLAAASKYVPSLQYLTSFFKPDIELPIKLIFPAADDHMSMLGLGDIVLPGLLVALASRIDAACALKLQQVLYDVEMTTSSSGGSSSSSNSNSTSNLISGSSHSHNHSYSHSHNHSGGSGQLSSLLGSTAGPAAVVPASLGQASRKPKLFIYSLIGYVLGLIAAFISSRVFHHAQPALIFLVPGTQLFLIGRAYHQGKLLQLWHGSVKATEVKN